MTITIKHQEVTAEMFTDEQGPLVCLTQQDYSGNDEHDTIHLHPWQLRAICEEFGILTSDREAEKVTATLKRRLRVLAERIEHLADYLITQSDSQHADLSYEQTYAEATAEIASEFVAELDDTQTATEPPERASERVEPSAGTDPTKCRLTPEIAERN